MTVAEKIKRSTKPLSFQRDFACMCEAVKEKTLQTIPDCGVGVYEYIFIDGSKLTCRVYW